jgi:hypothetical protein
LKLALQRYRRSPKAVGELVEEARQFAGECANFAAIFFLSSMKTAFYMIRLHFAQR